MLREYLESGFQWVKTTLEEIYISTTVRVRYLITFLFSAYQTSLEEKPITIWSTDVFSIYEHLRYSPPSEEYAKSILKGTAIICAIQIHILGIINF